MLHYRHRTFPFLSRASSTKHYCAHSYKLTVVLSYLPKNCSPPAVIVNKDNVKTKLEYTYEALPLYSVMDGAKAELDALDNQARRQQEQDPERGVLLVPPIEPVAPVRPRPRYPPSTTLEQIAPAFGYLGFLLISIGLILRKESWRSSICQTESGPALVLSLATLGLNFMLASISAIVRPSLAFGMAIVMSVFWYSISWGLQDTRDFCNGHVRIPLLKMQFH